MTEEEREIIMLVLRKDFNAKIAEMDTYPEWFYNTHQIGLYHQKPPNGVYFDEANKKDYAGVKKM